MTKNKFLKYRLKISILMKKTSKKTLTNKKISRKKNTKKKAPANLTTWLKKRPHHRKKIFGNDVIVLGTAHVSAESVEDVRYLYKTIKPGTVAIELCKSRFDSMNDKDRWRKLDLSRVIKEKKLWLLVSSLILSAFQKKIGETTGTKPGEEMMVASELAKKGKSRIVLADREVRTTLSRAWARVSWFRKMWLGSYLLTSLLVSEDIKEEDIEELKQQDVLEDMLSALPPRFSYIKEVIIDERDRYLAEKIRLAALENSKEHKKGKSSILAVVGAGHLPGIRKFLNEKQQSSLQDLDVVPKKSNLGAIISLVAFMATMAGFSWIGFIKGSGTLADMAWLWIIGRSAGAGLGALIARAKPLTILVTIVVAPVAYFIGFIGFRLWMLTALMELRERKPRVEDFENIAADTQTFTDFRHALYNNRVIHLIFLIFATGMGLTLGNLPFIITYLQIIWDMISRQIVG